MKRKKSKISAFLNEYWLLYPAMLIAGITLAFVGFFMLITNWPAVLYLVGGILLIEVSNRA